MSTTTTLAPTTTATGEAPPTITDPGQTQDGTTTAKAGEGAEQQTTQQGQQAEETKEGEAKADGAAPGALELKLPEGVEADQELLGAFRDVAKESGLKGEAAQKVVDAYVQAQARAEEKAKSAWEQRQQEWVKEVEADKEFGGDRLTGTKAAAEKALARFGSPQLSEFLNVSGLGNHPELVRLVARVGQAMAEDSVAGSTSTAADAPSDPFESIYTTMKKE